MEQLLTQPRQPRQQQGAEYFTIDAAAADDKGGRKPNAPTTASNTKTDTTDAASRRWGASNAEPKNPKGNNQDSGGGFSGHGGTSTGTPTGDGMQQAGGANAAATSADAAAAAATAGASATGGADAAAIRFGGATTDEQETDLLRDVAVQAVEAARVKFAEAAAGQDTHNAALLFAHQQVLARIGTPSSLAEVYAYERWRTALGQHLERIAAERLGGAAW